MLLEGRELGVPVGLQLVQPGLHGDHRLRPEPEITQSRIMRYPLVGHDARRQQYPQVPAHGRGRHADSGREFSRAAGLSTEQLNDAEPGRVSQRAEDDDHVSLAADQVLSHKQNSSLSEQ